LSSLTYLWRYEKKNIFTRLKDFIEIFFITKSNKIISPSCLLANKLKINIKSNIKVLRTLIDMDKITIKSMKFKIPLKKNYILFIGVLNKRKGFVKILNLLKKYNKFFLKKKISFYIVSQRNELNNFYNKQFNDILKYSNVKYFENLKKNKIYYLLSKCSCILIPSIIDNLPNILLESIKMQSNIISFRNNSIDEIITNNKTGFLIKNKKVQEIFFTIKKVLDLSLNKKKIIKRNLKKLGLNYNYYSKIATKNFYEKN